MVLKKQVNLQRRKPPLPQTQPALPTGRRGKHLPFPRGQSKEYLWELVDLYESTANWNSNEAAKTRRDANTPIHSSAQNARLLRNTNPTKTATLHNPVKGTPFAHTLPLGNTWAHPNSDPVVSPGFLPSTAYEGGIHERPVKRLQFEEPLSAAANIPGLRCKRT